MQICYYQCFCFILCYLFLIFIFCSAKIIPQREEADAVTVDGGEVYTAGKCGLVPVMVEQYDQGANLNKLVQSCVFYSKVST